MINLWDMDEPCFGTHQLPQYGAISQLETNNKSDRYRIGIRNLKMNKFSSVDFLYKFFSILV